MSLWTNTLVIAMKKMLELPLTEPVYSTYHYQGAATAVLVNNPSIRNWYLNEIFILTCSRKFLRGFTTPEIGIAGSSWNHSPYLDKKMYPMQFLGGYINQVIRNLLNSGYYVFFVGIDDYYVKGKSLYQKRHFSHDGCICGYNRDDKTYCIYAYDLNWIYQKFWTTQKSFDDGRKAVFKTGQYGSICGIKPNEEYVAFSAETALKKIDEYLDSSMEKYPENEDGTVLGIIVHDYIAKYVGKLYDGSIPYEKTDSRIFRLIWEHKKIMLERIVNIERALGMDTDISKRYEALVTEADTMRMLYASHSIKRRDSILPVIQKKLLSLREKEQMLLTELLERAKGGK